MKKINILLGILSLMVFFAGMVSRIYLFTKDDMLDGDYGTHIEAVETLLRGENPYKDTVKTYADLKDNPSNKGYAYFPGILYSNTVFYAIELFQTDHNFTILSNISYLYAIPNLLGNILIGLFLLKYFWSKNRLFLIVSLAVWFANPFVYVKESLEGFDPLPVGLALWAVYFAKKDSVAGGALLALAVMFKTFPIILFPLLFLTTLDKKRFLASFTMVSLFLSAPFLKSAEFFSDYIRGALLVHAERFIQGRPFLYYISYFYKVEFFRTVPFKFYAVFSIVGGWVLTSFLYLFKRTNLKLLAGYFSHSFFVAMLCFFNFNLFTPVLNRTYLVWGIPFVLVGLYEVLSGGRFYRKTLYLCTIAVYWYFMFWYLRQWKEGFHIWFPV